jgi:RNA methyltransferase, TrmH family
MKITPKEYKKDFKYSYASGVFATLELLKTQPKEVLRVFLNKHGEKNKGLDQIIELCQQHSIPIEWADGLIMKLSHSENCYALGVFNKYSSPLEDNQNHVVLVNPSDMGNMGTIIRTMVGFGFKNLVIIRPGADIFDPKVVRASTGAFFRINYQYFHDFEEYRKSFPKHKVYTLMLKASKSLEAVEFTSPFSIVFGAEGSGLPDRYLHVGTSIRIPHSWEIDSLNLSIAAGITLYRAKG